MADYTDDQIKDYAHRLEVAGASAAEIEQFVQGAKGHVAEPEPAKNPATMAEAPRVPTDTSHDVPWYGRLGGSIAGVVDLPRNEADAIARSKAAPRGLALSSRLASSVLAGEGGPSGAAISGGGEKLAQLLEGENDPRALAQATALGAIPIGKLIGGARAALRPLVAPAVAGGTNLAVNTAADAAYGANPDAGGNAKQAATVAAITAALPMLAKPLMRLLSGNTAPVIANGKAGDLDALLAGRRQGMVVIPSSTGKEGMLNSILESVGGMGATKKAAQIKNDAAAMIGSREHVRLPADSPLSVSTLDNRRTEVSGPYQEAGALGDDARAAVELQKQRVAERPLSSDPQESAMTNDESPAHAAVMKSIRTQAGADLKELQTANKDLNKAWRDGKTSTERAPYEERVQKLLADLEAAAHESGDPGLISRIEEAKKEMAKTYDIQDSLNHGNNSVDLSYLGKRYQADPDKMTGAGADMGKFAQAYQKSGVIGDGRPQMDPGNSGTNAAFAALAMLREPTKLPKALAKALVIGPARSTARSVLLSEPYQNSLLRTDQKLSPQTLAIMARLAAQKEVQDAKKKDRR